MAQNFQIMETTKIGLVTEAFGHGFFAVKMCKALGLELVAFSEKETQEEFEAQVSQIMTNLSFIAPEMRPAKWEERETLPRRGWNARQSLLDGEITEAEWKLFAEYPALQPEIKEPLPRFLSVPRYRTNIMFVPQKLVSDGQCGVTAAQQSVQPQAFNFMKTLSNVTLILGQHFHKVNDLDKIEALIKEFKCYVPGYAEDREVFGIRGIAHKQYYNLYAKTDLCMGIAGTHTWYLLTCFPSTPQIILYNRKGVENWEKIAEAYKNAGYQIYAIGFDELTDMNQLGKKMEEIFNSL